jgi:hypothetical protein
MSGAYRPQPGGLETCGRTCSVDWKTFLVASRQSSMFWVLVLVNRSANWRHRNAVFLYLTHHYWVLKREKLPAFSECIRWISLIVPESSSKDVRKENINTNAKAISTKIILSLVLISW